MQNTIEKFRQSSIVFEKTGILSYTNLLEVPRFPYQERFHNKGQLNLAT